MLGENRDIFFPELNEELNLITFSEIAIRFLENTEGYEGVLCESEDEARLKVHELKKNKKWPCYFFKSDTTGEKDFEEFYTDKEVLDLEKFVDVGIIKNEFSSDEQKLKFFKEEIQKMKNNGRWAKNDLVELFMNFFLNLCMKKKLRTLIIKCDATDV